VSRARSTVVYRGRFPPRLRIASWWRRTTISSSRSRPPRASTPTRQHRSRYSKPVSTTRQSEPVPRRPPTPPSRRNRVSLPHTPVVGHESGAEVAPRLETASTRTASSSRRFLRPWSPRAQLPVPQQICTTNRSSRSPRTGSTLRTVPAVAPVTIRSPTLRRSRVRWPAARVEGRRLIRCERQHDLVSRARRP
jgi:hypothetical protein